MKNFLFIEVVALSSLLAICASSSGASITDKDCIHLGSPESIQFKDITKIKSLCELSADGSKQVMASGDSTLQSLTDLLSTYCAWSFKDVTSVRTDEISRNTVFTVKDQALNQESYYKIADTCSDDPDQAMTSEQERRCVVADFSPKGSAYIGDQKLTIEILDSGESSYSLYKTHSNPVNVNGNIRYDTAVTTLGANTQIQFTQDIGYNQLISAHRLYGPFCSYSPPTTGPSTLVAGATVSGLRVMSGSVFLLDFAKPSGIFNITFECQNVNTVQDLLDVFQPVGIVTLSK